MRRVIVAAIVIIATLGGIVLLWQFRIALVLFALSLAVAAMARPAVDWWIKHGVPRGIALLLTYAIGLLLLAALIILISRPLLDELQRATDELASTYQRITLTWPFGTQMQQLIAAQLPEPERLYAAIAGERGEALIQNIFGAAGSVFSVAAQFLIVLVLSIYWGSDRVRFERLWLSLLPVNERNRARDIWRAVEIGVGEYLRSEVIQTLLAGILLGTGYYLIGIPYPILLAIFSSLLWLIPWLGAVLAVVLPFLVGLASSATLAAAAATFTFIVLLVLEVVVEPRIFNRHQYSSLLVVLFVVALADAYGPVGLLLAPPLAAAVQIFGKSMIRISSPIEATSSRSQLLTLHQRLNKVQNLVSSQPTEEASPEAINLVKRLTELVDETTTLFQVVPEETSPPQDLSEPLRQGSIESNRS